MKQFPPSLKCIIINNRILNTFVNFDHAQSFDSYKLSNLLSQQQITFNTPIIISTSVNQYSSSSSFSYSNLLNFSDSYQKYIINDYFIFNKGNLFMLNNETLSADLIATIKIKDNIDLKYAQTKIIFNQQVFNHLIVPSIINLFEIVVDKDKYILAQEKSEELKNLNSMFKNIIRQGNKLNIPVVIKENLNSNVLFINPPQTALIPSKEYSQFSNDPNDQKEIIEKLDSNLSLISDFEKYYG
jgi:hypothetical protein